jgi:hypothetical protein
MTNIQKLPPLLDEEEGLKALELQVNRAATRKKSTPHSPLT